MVSQAIDPTEVTAAMACVTKFDDHYVGKTDQDSKLDYLEGLVKAAKAFADLVRILLSGLMK